MTYDSNFASRFIFMPLLIVTLILHVGVFGNGVHNPIGIRGLDEAYTVLSMGLFLLLMLSANEHTSREFRLISYYVVFTCLVYVFGSMVFSRLMYGQPFLYGFAEERRVLFCLGFAPLLLLGKRVNASQFERALIVVALLSALLSWGFKFGIVPDLRDEVASHDRPDRSSIGVPLMCLMYFYCLHLWAKGESLLDGSKRSKMPYLIIAVMLLLTLILATQTRQLIALCLIFTLLYLRLRAVIWAVFAGALLGPLFMFPEILQSLGIDLSFYTEQAESGVEDGVRPYTIEKIFTHLDQVNWLPSGALSLMWQNGFVPYFGEQFFLSDVGFFGLLFRFGFLTFLIVPVTFFIYQRIAKSLHSDMTFIYAVMLSYIAIWPLNGLLTFNQSLIAMLFVLQALKAQYSRGKESIYEYRAYPQLQGSQ